MHAVDVKLDDIDLFQDFLVLYERHQGIPRIRVCSLQDPQYSPHVIPLPSEHSVCIIIPGVNRDFHSQILRFSISTPLVPSIVFDYNMKTRKSKICK